MSLSRTTVAHRERPALLNYCTDTASLELLATIHKSLLPVRVNNLFMTIILWGKLHRRLSQTIYSNSAATDGRADATVHQTEDF